MTIPEQELRVAAEQIDAAVNFTALNTAIRAFHDLATPATILALLDRIAAMREALKGLLSGTDGFSIAELEKRYGPGEVLAIALGRAAVKEPKP